VPEGLPSLRWKRSRHTSSAPPPPQSLAVGQFPLRTAAEIEQYRHTYHITDPGPALVSEPHDRAQGADRQRVRTAVVYLLTAVDRAFWCRWPLPGTVLMMLAGTIPFLP
jgi:hypothetical protein